MSFRYILFYEKRLQAKAVPRYKIFYIYDIFLRLVNSSKDIIIKVLVLVYDILKFLFFFFDELTNFFDKLTSLFDELKDLYFS